MKIFVNYVSAKSKAKNIASTFITNSSKLFHVQYKDIYLQHFQRLRSIFHNWYQDQLKMFATIDEL